MELRAGAPSVCEAPAQRLCPPGSILSSAHSRYPEKPGCAAASGFLRPVFGGAFCFRLQVRAAFLSSHQNGQGGQAPSGRGARSSTHSPSSSTSPRPPPSDLGLCVIFTRLDCLHRSPRSPFPLRGDLPPSSGLEFPWAPGGMEQRPATTKNVLEAMVRASRPLGCTCWTQTPPGTSWQRRDKPTETVLSTRVCTTRRTYTAFLPSTCSQPSSGKTWNGHSLLLDSSISPSFHSLTCSFIFLPSFNICMFTYFTPALVWVPLKSRFLVRQGHERR